MDELCHRPRNRQPVVGASAAPYLVQYHQGPRRGVIENGRRLQHLDHERRLARREVVLKPDAREDPVDDADGCRLGGNEAADLRHQRDDRNLTDESRLARHVRTGKHDDLLVAGGKSDVVRHELPRLDHVLDDRMPSLRDSDRVSLVQLGPHVPLPLGNLRQGREGVDARDCPRDRHDRPRGVRNLPADLTEQTRLQLGDPLLRVQDERLVLLHLRRDEAFGVHQCLAADVLLRGLRQVGAADLDVVAEDLVVPDLQRLDARPLALGLLQRRDVILSLPRRVAELVQIVRKALSYDPAVSHVQRRIVGHRPADEVNGLRCVVHSVRQPGDRPRVAVLAKNVPYPRRSGQAPAKTDHVAGSRRERAHLVDEPLDVRDLLQRRRHAASAHRAAMEPLHRVLTLGQLRHVEERPSHPAPKLARAHRSPGAVERREQ